MTELLDIFKARIKSGLARSSVTSCSKWAETYREMGKPYPGLWRWEHHPWLREMHDCNASQTVGQKSAQMGFTEWALNTVFYSIDILRIDTLYVLPSSHPDASDFSAARFDPALELSDHLYRLFSDVKNVGHKRAGSTNLYIRGSKSRSQLKSIPAGLLILDELDEMMQENISLAMERTSGQREEDKRVLMLSTPTVEGYGINAHFKASDQRHFFFKCPCCSRYTELVFPDCMEIIGEHPTQDIVMTSFLKCKECKGKLEHKDKKIWLAQNEWVKSYDQRTSAGFYVNQLYSSTVSPGDLAKAYLTSLTDKSAEQEFYNSKLGLTHAVEGASVTDKDIQAARGEYKNGTHAEGFLTMGVDVGVKLHYAIRQWYFNPVVIGDLNATARCRTLKYGTVLHFHELDEIMYQFRPKMVVIDAQPERRKAHEFSMRFPGDVRVCFYVGGIRGKQIHQTKEDVEYGISVDRTSWLDLTLGRFHAKSISIPADVDEEYQSHLKCLVRIYDKDKDGNPIGKYVKGGGDDHYAHAENYAEIAFAIASGRGSNQTIYE